MGKKQENTTSIDEIEITNEIDHFFKIYEKNIKSPKYIYRWLELDKKLVEYLLSNRMPNRKEIIINMARIKDDMKRNQFYPQGQPIIISDKGRLMDGSNRLKSALNSKIFDQNKTLMIDAIFMVPEKRFTSLDTGKSRTIVNLFESQGIKGKYISYLAKKCSAIVEINTAIKDSALNIDQDKALFSILFKIAGYNYIFYKLDKGLTTSHSNIFNFYKEYQIVFDDFSRKVGNKKFVFSGNIVYSYLFFIYLNSVEEFEQIYPYMIGDKPSTLITNALMKISESKGKRDRLIIVDIMDQIYYNRNELMTARLNKRENKRIIQDSIRTLGIYEAQKLFDNRKNKLENK